MGSAAAAIGAILVLTAGVPASQADGGSGADEPDVQVSGGAQLPVAGGFLQGLLGDSAAASPQPTPVPEATTASPPPTTASPPPTTGAAATGTATPVPAPSPLAGTATAVPLQQPAAGQPAAASTAAGFAPGVAGSEAGTPAASQPAAEGSEAAAATPAPTSSTPGPTATTRTGVPQAVGGAAQSQHEMSGQTEPAAEAAKVWLGVGLVGSAGAAGLVFTRIRRF